MTSSFDGKKQLVRVEARKYTVDQRNFLDNLFLTSQK